VSETVAERLFAGAARVLRPGGELWCVYNSHLPHREALRRIVGYISAENATMLRLASRAGFHTARDPDDPALVQAVLDL
jgi:hypothetical protein